MGKRKERKVGKERTREEGERLEKPIESLFHSSQFLS
jgi:hypothetical protein